MNGELYISYFDVVKELMSLWPDNKNKKMLERWEALALRIHGLKTYTVDERNRLVEFHPTVKVLPSEYLAGKGANE